MASVIVIFLRWKARQRSLLIAHFAIPPPTAKPFIPFIVPVSLPLVNFSPKKALQSPSSYGTLGAWDSRRSLTYRESGSRQEKPPAFAGTGELCLLTIPGMLFSAGEPQEGAVRKLRQIAVNITKLK
jgi:hypothetical protein